MRPFLFVFWLAQQLRQLGGVGSDPARGFSGTSIIQRQGKSDCPASLALLIAAQAGGRAAPLRLPPAPFQVCGVVLTPQSGGYLRAFGSVPQVA